MPHGPTPAPSAQGATGVPLEVASVLDAQFAARLMPHARAGVTADLLAELADHVPDVELRTAPADPLAARLIRRDAKQAARVATAVSSPALLGQLARTERRRTVRHALGANPALPWDGATLLATAAATTGDDELARALVAARPARERVRLLLADPTFRVVHPAAATQLAHDLSALAEPDLMELAADSLAPAEAAEILTLLGVFGTPALPGPLLRLLQTAGTGSGDPVVARLAPTLLPAGCPAEHQRLVLQSVPCSAVVGQLLELAASGADSLPLADVLRAADPASMPGHVQRLARLGLVVDETVAALIDVPGAPASAHAALTVTPQARALLAGSVHPATAGAHMVHCPDAVERVGAMTPERRAGLLLGIDQVAQLSAGGLDLETVLELLPAEGVGRARLAEHQALRSRLVAGGPDALLVSLRLQADDVDTVVGRADARELPWSLRALLDLDLPRDQQLAVADLLGSAALVSWLDRGGDVADAELRWLLGRRTDGGAELVAELARRLCAETDGSEPWRSVAASVVPLPWGRIRSSSALRAALDELEDRLVAPSPAWRTALSLLPTWSGSLGELVEVARTVVVDPRDTPVPAPVQDPLDHPALVPAGAGRC